MEAGVIHPNLHYKNPRIDIPAIADEKIRIVTEVTPWDGEYIGVNSFGFGGANAHILLKSNKKKKNNNDASNNNLPRLVFISGRTEEAVVAIIEDVRKLYFFSKILPIFL